MAECRPSFSCKEKRHFVRHKNSCFTFWEMNFGPLYFWGRDMWAKDALAK